MLLMWKLLVWCVPADPIYLAYNPFFSRLLGDWSVRTEDPWDADLIYVPALT